MISKTRTAVQEIIRKFYYDHHDKIKMESDLVDSINSGRVSGSTSTKRQIVEALDYRVNRLTESLEVLRKNGNQVQSVIDDMESRVDELETFRHYVKGMVFKADE